MNETKGLPELPHGWSLTTLGDVVNPTRPKVSPSTYPDFPFIGMEHVEAHTMELLGTVPASTMKSNAVHFFPHDVLYGRLRPYLNKVVCPEFEGLCSSEFIVFPANESVSSKFIQHLLNTLDFVTFASRLNEGDRPRVDFSQIAAYRIKLPPLPEQQRIIAKIEELFTKLDVGVTALKTALTLLGRYRQSVLKAAVTGELTREWRETHRGELEPASDLLARILRERRANWEADQLAKMQAAGKPPKNDDWKQKYLEPESPDTSELPIVDSWCWTILETVAEAIDPQPSHRTPPEVVNGIPYVGMGDITRDKKIDLINARKVSADVLEEHKQRYQLKDGDFFIGKIGTIGKPVKLTAPFNYALSANIVLIQPKPTYTEEKFAFIYMASPYVEKLLAKGSRATTQAAFGIQKVRLLPYPLPPITEQQQIVSEVERLLSIADAMEQTIEQSLKQAERLRQSILQQAFSGKLVPQDPNDEPAESLLARIKAERAQNGSALQKPRRRSRKQKEPIQPSMLP